MGHSHKNGEKRSGLLVILLSFLGVYLAASIVIATLDPTGFFSGVFSIPGRFFFSMFHAAAWWVPVYFGILAFLAAKPSRVSWGSVALINLVHIPVLTIAAILRLLTYEPQGAAPLLTILMEGFTLRGAMLVLSLVLAIESIALLQVWRWFEIRSRRAEHDEEDPPKRRPLRLPAPAKGPAIFNHDDEEREPDPAVYTTSDEGGTAPPSDTTITDTALEERLETGDQPLEGRSSESELSSREELKARLAELRRKMEDGLEGYTDEEDNVSLEMEPPLPLIFRRTTDDEKGDEYDDDEYEDDDDEIELAGWEDENSDDDEEIIDEYELNGSETIENAPAEREPVEPKKKRRGRAYRLPVEGILHQYSDGHYWEIDDGTRDAGEVLRVTLEEFGISAEVTGIRKGPVITMFEILPAPGVKLAKITNLADNIALRLAASSVRIVAPIPGKHAVGIEIPNKERNIVSFAELLRDDEFFGDSCDIPIALGKDIAGEAQIVDLAKTPHMLIAGATGSGKSVCVNSIICSILYRRNPSEVKLILIDPKIVELKFYNDIPHLLTPVITDPKRAFQALQYLIYEMERRYSLLDSLGARDIGGYNARIKRKNLATEPLPYIVVLIDEFADLMATSGKELESTVARLAAMSRAVGIHIVLATQRPSTDVITGLIKANIPSRIAFMVASKVDSRIIIDTMGAEKLLGRGDMLYTSAADPFPVRMQGAFLSEDEVERVVTEVKTFGEPDYIDDEIFIEEDDETDAGDVLEDPLMERAIEVVTSSNKASASYLQRRLKVGYNRAARMVEEMERMGIVGPQNGSKPRDVLGTGY